MLTGNPFGAGRPTKEDLERIRTRKAEEPKLEVTLKDGSKRTVWCTFGPQQIDIDVSSPSGETSPHNLICILEFTTMAFRNKTDIALPGTSKAGEVRDGSARLATLPTPVLKINHRTHPPDACIPEQLKSDDCMQAESLWRTRCAHCVSGELGWSGWMPMAMLPRRRAPDASLRYAADLSVGVTRMCMDV